MNNNSQFLSCVMIPMADRQLLLPNVSIAEVVDAAFSDPGAGRPDWVVGYLDWRGLQLAVISYDAANGGTLAVPGTSRGRIVVLNTIGGRHNKSPFMALLAGGIPSQARLTGEQIRSMEGKPGPADLMQVEVEGESAWIPNLEYLEALVSES